MQSQSTESQAIDTSGVILQTISGLSNSDDSMAEELTRTALEPTQFHSRFVDCMEMYADAETVAQYLGTHHGWFPRCANPMRVESISENGYALVIGQFGAFGYEVEPKVGLDLLPPDEQGVYRIVTIPVPGYIAPGYDVDFKAALELVEVPPAPTSTSSLTRVEWQLDLTVSLQFPRFIHALPKSLIQNTGDRILRQIVRQVSRRLTFKVQEDFHTTHNIDLPRDFRRNSSNQE